MYKQVLKGNNFLMKKIIAFVLLAFLLLFVIKFEYGNNNSDDLLTFDGIEKLCIVTKKSDISSNNTVETMVYNYVYYKNDEIPKQDFQGVEGLIFYLDNADFEKIKNSLNLFVEKRDRIDDKEIIYGFTPKFEKSVFVEKKKVNVEIVLNHEKAIVGMPMILSGY